MADDPYAQYLTPPAAAAPSAPASGDDDPYAKYLAPPTASAETAKPAYAGGGPVTDTALAFLDHLGLGLGTKNPFMEMPAQLKQDVAQAHSNIGPGMDVPLSIAAYMLGPGKVLGPAGKLIGGAGGAIGSAAAEGGLAGGISGFDPNNPIGSTVGGAGGGALLGGAAGGLAKGVGAAGNWASKIGQPAIDPAAEIARTQGITDAAYAAQRQVSLPPMGVHNAIDSVMSNLDPSVETGMSGTLRRQINDVQQALREQDVMQRPVNLDQVTSWQRQIDDAASRERYPSDKAVAGQIEASLNQFVRPFDPQGLQAAADEAFKNKALAQNMADWQARIKAGGSVGQAPLTEAETYYKGDPEKAQALADLYNQGQHPSAPTWAMGHIAANTLGALGHMVAGYPGVVGGEALGYLVAKPAITKAMKGVDRNLLLKAYQAKYPTLTGATQQPGPLANLTGVTADPRVGELIKNAMIGGAY